MRAAVEKTNRPVVRELYRQQIKHIRHLIKHRSPRPVTVLVLAILKLVVRVEHAGFLVKTSRYRGTSPALPARPPLHTAWRHRSLRSSCALSMSDWLPATNPTLSTIVPDITMPAPTPLVVIPSVHAFVLEAEVSSLAGRVHLLASHSLAMVLRKLAERLLENMHAHPNPTLLPPVPLMRSHSPRLRLLPNRIDPDFRVVKVLEVHREDSSTRYFSTSARSWPSKYKPDRGSLYLHYSL